MIRTGFDKMRSRSKAIFSDSPRVHAIQSLKRWIAEDILVGGARLPSEQQLASRLDVSRTTVRYALQQLEREGLIEVVNGSERTIARGKQQQRSLMSDTVTLLTNIANPGGETYVPGRVGYIQLGASEAIHAQGLHALTLNPEKLDVGSVAKLFTERPRGIICVAGALLNASGRELLASIKANRLPLVVYDDERRMPEFDTVSSDHAKGSADLTRALIKRGCRRILRFWGLRHGTPERPGWLQQRDEGYLQAIREAGVPSLPAIECKGLPFDGSSAENFEQYRRLYAGHLVEHLSSREPVDAIMATSDGLVFPIAAACRILGKAPNKDVLMAGYDDYWRDCAERQWEPDGPLLTVNKKNLNIGRALVELLMQRISGKLGAEPEHRVIAPELVELTAEQERN